MSDPRKVAAPINAAAARDRLQRIQKQCRRHGHDVPKGADCCQRCKLPVEMMGRYSKRKS